MSCPPYRQAAPASPFVRLHALLQMVSIETFSHFPVRGRASRLQGLLASST